MPPLPNAIARSLEAYAPGEQPQEPGFIKLNTNEFPYPAAPEVLEAIRRAATDDVRLYPSPRCEKLRARLADRHGISPDMILVGNGSDEILRLLIQAYLGPGRLGAMVDPTYSLYKTLFQSTGSDYKVFLLYELERLPAEIFESDWDMLLLPVPNAPIGNVFSLDELGKIARKGNMLVLDEAYIDFASGVDHSALLRSYGNVVLTRTFSKSFGLAGMRVGYAIGHAKVIDQLSRMADSYNVNRISQEAALGALEAEAYYRAKGELIQRDRAWLGSELRKRGFVVPESQANFLFARRADARALYEGLKARKILVRYFSNPRLADGIRITIGTREELERLLAEIDAIG